jgi:hypothetical protein
MAAVEFDPAEFRAERPAFNDVPDDVLTAYFAAAEELCDNSESSRVPYDPDATPPVLTRRIVLYALVCHFGTLQMRGDSAVGAVTSASEGSVSSSFAALPSKSEAAAWFNQTQCGALAFLLLRRYALGGRLFNGCFR